MSKSPNDEFDFSFESNPGSPIPSSPIPAIVGHGTNFTIKSANTLVSSSAYSTSSPQMPSLPYSTNQLNESHVRFSSDSNLPQFVQRRGLAGDNSPEASDQFSYGYDMAPADKVPDNFFEDNTAGTATVTPLLGVHISNFQQTHSWGDDYSSGAAMSSEFAESSEDVYNHNSGWPASTWDLGGGGGGNPVYNPPTQPASNAMQGVAFTHSHSGWI